MTTKLFATLALAGGCAFAQNYNPGAPPPVEQNYPPEAYGAVGPACGPGTIWIDGYADAYGNQVPGYCAVPPYAGAYWIGPTWYGGRFVGGYWGRGPVIGGGFGYRGGYAPGFRGGFDRGRSFDAGRVDRFRSGSTFRAPARSEGFRAPSAGSNFHSGSGSHGAASPRSGSHAGGGSHGGGRR